MISPGTTSLNCNQTQRAKKDKLPDPTSAASRNAIRKRSAASAQMTQAFQMSSSEVLANLACFEGGTKNEFVSVEELRGALNECLDAFNLLPKNSRYAKARKACIKKCLERLDEMETSGERDLISWIQELKLK